MNPRRQPAPDERRLIHRGTEIADFKSALLRQFHDYWLAKRGARAMPAWSDIDPAEITRLLPNLIVTTIEYAPFRVFYRLVGTQVVEFRGEVTGHYLDAVPWNLPLTRKAVQETYQLAVDGRHPVFAEVEIRTLHDTRRRIFGGVWPLAPGADAPVDRCIAIEDYGSLSPSDLP